MYVKCYMLNVTCYMLYMLHVAAVSAGAPQHRRQPVHRAAGRDREAVGLQTVRHQLVPRTQDPGRHGGRGQGEPQGGLAFDLSIKYSEIW